jgi:hypothetical protein
MRPFGAVWGKQISEIEKISFWEYKYSSFAPPMGHSAASGVGQIKFFGSV